MHQYFADSKPLWKPRRPADSCADALRRQINPKYGLKLANYHDLHRYSVEDVNFWLELWEFLGIISSVPPQKTKILEKGVLDEVPLWFPGARLNYAENLLHRTDDAIAITATGESGVITNRTFRELRELVRVMAAALKVHGLKVGDRVAAIITNSLHSVVIALATASIGGIFSSTATDMGTSVSPNHTQVRFR